LAVDDFLLFKVFRSLEVDDFPKLLFKIENWKKLTISGMPNIMRKTLLLLATFFFFKLIFLCSLSGDRKICKKKWQPSLRRRDSKIWQFVLLSSSLVAIETFQNHFIFWILNFLSLFIIFFVLVEKKLPTLYPLHVTYPHICQPPKLPLQDLHPPKSTNLRVYVFWNFKTYA
jgi:preprotein translocase subunit SecG